MQEVIRTHQHEQPAQVQRSASTAQDTMLIAVRVMHTNTMATQDTMKLSWSKQ